MTHKTEVLNALARHQGSANGIPARDLARKLGIPTRRLRTLISALRESDGVAICGRPSTGYFMARTAEDLEETCQFLRNRAMHSLRMESRMRKISLADLVGQLKLNQA